MMKIIKIKFIKSKYLQTLYLNRKEKKIYENYVG